jgi:hypothetical protein
MSDSGVSERFSKGVIRLSLLDDVGSNYTREVKIS